MFRSCVVGGWRLVRFSHNQEDVPNGRDLKQDRGFLWPKRKFPRCLGKVQYRVVLKKDDMMI